jgi:hypothetical protein
MANPRLAPQYYQKNAITFQAHRRQVIWQVYLPIAVITSLVLIAAVLVVMAPALKISRWADIALIMLISIAMISALIFLALNIFTIIGTRRVLQILPYYLFMGQGFVFRLRSRLRIISDGVVEPVLWTKSNLAKLHAISLKGK